MLSGKVTVEPDNKQVIAYTQDLGVTALETCTHTTAKADT